MISVIISAIYAGWATPTEAGALGAFVVLIMAIYNKAHKIYKGKFIAPCKSL